MYILYYKIYKNFIYTQYFIIDEIGQLLLSPMHFSLSMNSASILDCKLLSKLDRVRKSC